VHIFRIKYGELGGGTKIVERVLGHKQHLTHLLQFLSRVSHHSASGNAFKNLVHKHPLLEHNYYKSDGLSSLRKQVITAAEKLGLYSRVIHCVFTGISWGSYIYFILQFGYGIFLILGKYTPYLVLIKGFGEGYEG
jgi:hypothetical protein